jgi:diguanylate cyclase (GGDEF)-like protein/putative nucleotidyltransferase with HDIG domain
MIERGQKLIDEGHKLTAVLIDLDNYKNINDTYGHFIGNNVLIQFAEVLRSVWPDALIGRLGGDEFVVLLTTENESSQVAAILEAMKNRSYVTDPDLMPISVAFSYGIAEQTSDEATIEQLLTISDKNMFYNKIAQKSKQISCEVEDIPEQFVDLLNVLSQKDMYTFIHSLYVAKFSKQLGEILGWNSLAVTNIALAGWLHDIGKIAIPNEILRKPAKLSDQEYRSIRKHVEYGLHLLQSFDIKNDVITAISEHHEKYDGTGYPFGKAREEISIEGRILAIADAYSAMTIKRVYQSRHLSTAEAVCELEKGKGYQFDPVLVEQFVSMITMKQNCRSH